MLSPPLPCMVHQPRSAAPRSALTWPRPCLALRWERTWAGAKPVSERIHPCRARYSDPAAALPRTVRCFSASWSWCEMLGQARGRSALRARPWRKCAAWVRGSHLCMALAQARLVLLAQVHCVPSFLTSGRPLQYHPAAGPMHPCRNPRQSTAALLVHYVPSQQPR